MNRESSDNWKEMIDAGWFSRKPKTVPEPVKTIEPAEPARSTDEPSACATQEEVRKLRNRIASLKETYIKQVPKLMEELESLQEKYETLRLDYVRVVAYQNHNDKDKKAIWEAIKGLQPGHQAKTDWRIRDQDSDSSDDSSVSKPGKFENGWDSDDEYSHNRKSWLPKRWPRDYSSE